MPQKFTVDDFQVCSTQLRSRAPAESAVIIRCQSGLTSGGRQAFRASPEAVVIVCSGNAASGK
jgi:hypothetical protein